MSVPVRLGAFAVVLVLVFGAALGVGAAVGPLDDGTGAPHGASSTDMQMDHDGG